jgi:hypothetical protein
MGNGRNCPNATDVNKLAVLELTQAQEHIVLLGSCPFRNDLSKASTSD